MKKPRITISLDPDDYAVLADLSDANGESMSSIVAGVVHAVTPALSRVANVVRVAAAAQGEAVGRLAAQMNEAEKVLTPMALANQAAYFQAMNEVIEAGQAGPVGTPASNTGVTISKPLVRRVSGSESETQEQA